MVKNNEPAVGVDDNGLSYNPELVNTKVIASDNVDPVDNTKSNVDIDTDIDPEDNGLVYNEDLLGGKFIRDKIYNIDVDEYLGDVGNGTEVYAPNVVGIDSIDLLNKDRADNQGFFEQAGNFLGQAAIGEVVGGTIEGFGYLLDIGSVIDVMQGDEADWGNFLTDLGQSVREGMQENFAIHQDPSAEGFAKMWDSGWWFSNGVSVASTLSMLVPTMGAMKALSFLGKGIGASKGMRALRKARGMAEEMGTKGKWMTNGISQAVLSRNIENWMEAHGTFEDYRASHRGEINPQTKKKFTEDELTKHASEAAASNWKKGWLMLAQDIPQYLALGRVFDPISKKMISATKAAGAKGFTANWKPWQQKGLAVAKTFFGEGAEESYQYLISEQSKLKADLDIGYITQRQYDKKISDAFGSEEMITSAFFGGLGGNLFQAAGGGVGKLFGSKNREEYEKNLAASYTEHIGNKAKQTALMFQYLNQSDAKGSKVLRDQVINDSMMTLATEALEMGKFDQFYETIGLVSEMSEADLKSFKEQTQQDFSPELAKEYAPELQEKAIEIRDLYVKHRNHYSPATSSRLARLEMENTALVQRAENGRGAATIARDKAAEGLKGKTSGKFYPKIELREKGKVLESRKKALEARLNAEEKDSVKIGFIQAALDDNARSIKMHEENVKDFDKAIAESTEDEKKIADKWKANDAAAEKTYKELYEEDVVAALEREAVAKENIIINNKDIAFSKSENGVNLTKTENLKKRIDEFSDNPSKIEAIAALENAKLNLDKEKEFDYLSSAEKIKIKDIVDAKVVELKKQIKEDEATAQAAATEAARLKRLEEANNNPKVVPNQVITDVVDSVEDENADTDPILSEEQIIESEAVEDALVETAQHIALLDKVTLKDGSSATPGYDEYVLTPVSKVGEEFRYTSVEMSQNLTTAQNDAISAFEKLSPGDEVTQDIIDNLPIQATHTKHSDVYTFLPTRPLPSAPLDDKRAYENGYAAQRELIINKILNGEDVTSTVEVNTGGDLMMQYDNDKRDSVPENSILDIVQINGDMSKVELMVTDKEGFLRDTNKQLDKSGLARRAMLLSKDSNDNRMPYRGGIFLKVKKANGEPFALRLNLKRNTRKQAEILAELLIKTSVPVADRDQDGNVILNKKGVQKVSKEIKLSTELEYLDEGLQADIREVMGPEIAMLHKYSNPTVNEIIDAFVYVSEQTESKTSELYIKGNDLMFGGKVVNLKNRAESATQEELIDFLQNKKRRQFKLSMWNENGAYRKYVLDNRIISTDAITDGPLFQNTRKKVRGEMTGRRVQLHMAPVKNEVKKELDSNGQVTTVLSLSDVVPGGKKVRKQAPLQPITEDEINSNPANWKKGDTIAIQISAKDRDANYEVEITKIFEDKYVEYTDPDSGETVQVVVNKDGVFENKNDQENGILRTAKLVPKESAAVQKLNDDRQLEIELSRSWSEGSNTTQDQQDNIEKEINERFDKAVEIVKSKEQVLEKAEDIPDKSVRKADGSMPDLSTDMVFDVAIGQQVAWDATNQTWVMKIDESNAISNETEFKKNGFTYYFMDFLPEGQQYQKQDGSSGQIVTEYLTKEQYEEARGEIDDNPFSVKSITFEEAQRLYEYSKFQDEVGVKGMQVFLEDGTELLLFENEIHGADDEGLYADYATREEAAEAFKALHAAQGNRNNNVETEAVNGDVSTLNLSNGKVMDVIFVDGKWHKQKKDGTPYKAALPKDKQDKLGTKILKPKQQTNEVEEADNVPKKGDIVTLEFYFEKEDKILPVKVTIENITEIEQGRSTTTDNKGNVIKEEPGIIEYELTLVSKKGRKYEVTVGRDGYISQFLGQNNKLRIGTDNYIPEFNLQTQPTQQTSEVEDSSKKEGNQPTKQTEAKTEVRMAKVGDTVVVDGQRAKILSISDKQFSIIGPPVEIRVAILDKPINGKDKLDVDDPVTVVIPKKMIVDQNPVLKKGSAQAYAEHPELAEIGTVEQYSDYLNKMFPKSKERRVVYLTQNSSVSPEDLGSLPKGNGVAFFNSERGEAYVFDGTMTGGFMNTRRVGEAAFVVNANPDSNAHIDEDGVVQFFNMDEKLALMLGSEKDLKGFAKYVAKSSKNGDKKISKKGTNDVSSQLGTPVSESFLVSDSDKRENGVDLSEEDDDDIDMSEVAGLGLGETFSEGVKKLDDGDVTEEC